jgi:hypothetical protein
MLGLDSVKRSSVQPALERRSVRSNASVLMRSSS